MPNGDRPYMTRGALLPNRRKILFGNNDLKKQGILVTKTPVKQGVRCYLIDENFNLETMILKNKVVW